MEWKTFAVVFTTVFLAELGDKTQIAAMLFASKSPGSLMTVFVASSLALVVASAIAVAAGALIGNTINPQLVSLIAGAGFVIIGAWIIVSALAGNPPPA